MSRPIRTEFSPIQPKSTRKITVAEVKGHSLIVKVIDHDECGSEEPVAHGEGRWKQIACDRKDTRSLIKTYTTAAYDSATRLRCIFGWRGGWRSLENGRLTFGAAKDTFSDTECGENRVQTTSWPGIDEDVER